MATVKFKRVDDSSELINIDIDDGSIIFTRDGKVYIDFEDERIGVLNVPDTEMNKLSSNAVENRVIKNYVDDVAFSIPRHRKMTVDNFLWDVVEYPDGFFEASVKIDTSRTFDGNYGYNNSQHWVKTGAIKFPFECEETPQVQVSAGSNGQLLDVSVATISPLQIALFLYCEVKLQNQPIYVSIFVRGNKAKTSEVSE